MERPRPTASRASSTACIRCLLQDEEGQILEAVSISAGWTTRASGQMHTSPRSVGPNTDGATDQEVLQAFRLLAETEGILPAVEAAHALAWLAREAGREVPLGSTVLATLSGRGDKDVAQVRESSSGWGPPLSVLQGREAGQLEAVLRTVRARGRKALVPYVMAGMSRTWPLVVQAVAAAGADAIELGLPFSDPMIDGPVIQEAARRAL